MKNRNKQNKKYTMRYWGYSFIEGVFATFIVTIGMIAVINLMTANLTVLVNSRNQTIATFLAQEGVEVARNIRDNNWAGQSPTFNNFPTDSKDNCRVDYNSTSIPNSACNNGNNSKFLKISNGIYSHSNGSDTSFQRKIIVNYVGGNSSTASYAKVTSVVTWNSHDFPDTLDPADCNSNKYCVYATVTLNKWGGND